MKFLNTLFGALVFSASSFLSLPLLGDDEYVGYTDISITSTYAPFTESRYNIDYDSKYTQAFLNADSSTLLVTARWSNRDENGLYKNSCGSFRVLKLNDGIWTETFARSGNFEYEYLGSEADMSADGQTIAIQSSVNDSGNIERVIVYANEDGEWSQKGSSITISSTTSDHYEANFAMDDSGSRIVVGDARALNSSGSSGSFTIYDFIDGEWVSQGTFENSFYNSIGGSYFSYHLDISGDGKTIISSLYGSNDNNIFIYKLSDGNGIWDDAEEFTDSNGNGVWDDAVGEVLGDNPDTPEVETDFVLVAAVSAEDFVDAGNGVWSLSEQLNVGNISGWQTDESIKLNGDGSTFVASRNAYGVRVYKSTGSGYQQLGSELTSELTGGSSFGWSSDINYAGNTILVGSPYEDSGELQNSGSLRLFKFTNGDWQQYGKTYYGASDDILGLYQVSLSSSGQSFVSSGEGYSSRDSRGVYGYGEVNLSDFSITSTDGSYILSSANSSISGNIELPYTINHSPYKLSPSVFKDCTLLESISLPDFIDEIPDSAFENCTSLKSVEFGSLTTSIGDNAFKNCSNLIISEPLLDITLVGESAFENSGITFFNIAPGCSVGNDAFKDASFLKTITIGEGSTFGSNVFASCASLDYVYLDETPDTFSSDFFTSVNPDIILISNSDRSFDLSSLSNQVEYIDIDNYTIGSSVLSSASNLLLDVYIPAFYEGEYITSIADYNDGNALVKSNHTITSVNVPPNYEAIPKRFINRCNAFSGAFLPDSITSIKSHAFAYNPILSDISLPRHLNSIGDYFLAETFVDGIIIPETINEIPNGAFAGCSVLTSLTFPNTITNIGNSAFTSTNLNTIEIPASVRSIKGSTFNSCNNLETVILNEGLESIESSAFSSCNNLTSVQLPNSLTSIGNYAFYNSGLTSISIPGGVTNVPEYTFSNCNNLETVILNEGVESIGMSAFADCNNLTSVQLPNSLTSIGNYAFYNSGLTSINIPGGIINVPNQAFNYCNNLETVNLNEGTRIISTDAFRYTNISEISLPSTIQLISDGAFQSSGLNRIIFKGNYPTIVGAPFSGSSEALTFYRTSNSTGFDNISEYTVKYIEVDAGVLEFITDGSQATLISCDSSAEGNLIVPATFNDLPVRSISNNALKDCSLINSIELPESIVDIGSSAFAGCTSLSSINIPSGVTQIKDNSFDGCISLTSIQFPVGLNSIGAYAFQNCGFSELSFPDALASIGQSAFSDCDAIASLTVNASLNLALASFSNMDSLQNVYFNGDNIYGDSSSIFSGSNLLDEIFVLKQATGWSDQFEGIDVIVQTPIYFAGDIVETGVQLFVDEQCIIRAYNEGQDPLDYTYQWYLDGFPIQAIFNGRNNQFLIEGSDFYQSNWSVEVTDISSGTTNTFNFYLDIIRDSDGDGLFDYVETGTGTFVSLEDTGTYPNNSDSDGDTIDDKTEILLGLNPNNIDSDGDGLNDNNETGTGVYVSIYDTGTDPLLDDSDSDGFSDSFEVSLINFNPTNYNNFQFSDHGMYAINDPALLNYIKDLRPGSVAISVQGEEATISMDIQTSTDLVNWEDDSYIDVPMPIEEGDDTKFFRFKMAE